MSGISYHLLTFVLYLSLPVGTYFLGKCGAERPDRPSVDSLDGRIPSRANRPQRRIEQNGRPTSSRIYFKFQEEGPSAALDEVLGMGDIIVHDNRLRVLLDELSGDDLVELIESFDYKRYREFRAEFILAVYALIEKDPSAAFAYMGVDEPDELRQIKNEIVIEAFDQIARSEADGQ